MPLSPTRLRTIREARHLTRTQLAADVGITEQSVAKYERGTNVAPRPETLRRLAAVLNVPVADLLDPEPVEAQR